MTDYNNGKWHGWNGGECPVHPETLVDIKLNNGTEAKGHKASTWEWDSKSAPIIAFRVAKPYVEPLKPLEVWVNVYEDGQIGKHHKTETEARAYAHGWQKFKTVRLREVVG